MGMYVSRECMYLGNFTVLFFFFFCLFHSHPCLQEFGKTERKPSTSIERINIQVAHYY